MMKTLIRTLFALAAISLLLTFTAAAQAPNTIMYQGRLTDSDGEPITTQVSVTFAIYAAPTGGTALHEQTDNITPDGNGIFTVELGPVDATDFDGSARFLGLKVGSDAEMEPRQLLTSAPYSVSTSNIPDNSVTAAKIADAAVTTPKIATGAVTTNHIANNTVSSSDIANGTITGSDIAANTIAGSNIANGTVQDIDIDDEPGIGQSYVSNSESLTSTVQVIDSIVLDCPSSGYVVVHASAYFTIFHTQGGGAHAPRAYLSQTRASMDNENFILWEVPTNYPSGTSHNPFQMVGVFSVSAGTEIFYLNGDVYVSGSYQSSSSDRIGRPHMLATFYPTSYQTAKSGVATDDKTLEPATPAER